MHPSIAAARLEAVAHTQDASDAFRLLLALCAPHEPMDKETFESRCVSYADNYETETVLAKPHFYSDYTKGIRAFERQFSNGAVAIWSCAGYLAYRTDPRF